MKSSDVVSSLKVPPAGVGTRKSSHLKLVDKAENAKSDANDALSSLFGKGHGLKASSAKGGSKAELKADVSLKADDPLQAQFAALLSQVETKLKNPKALAGDQGDANADTDNSDASADDTSKTDEVDAAALKSQNGTTSMFANAVMMRGWEPALISPAAEQAETESEIDSTMTATPANNNASENIKSAGHSGKAGLSIAAKGAADVKAEVQPDPAAVAVTVTTAPMVQNVDMPVQAKAASASPDDQVEVKAQTNTFAVTETPVSKPQMKATKARDSKPETRVAVTSSSAQQAFAAENVAKSGSAAKTAVPIQPEATDGAAGTNPAQVLADAKASGLVSEIHVTHQRDSNNDQNDRSADSDKGSAHKDLKANANSAEPVVQADVKAGAAVAATAITSTEAVSPVSQVVERILQELPAQIASADPNQVAQASKVLTVHLHPEGLGNVLIRISGSGDNMKISVASEQKATSDQLEADSTQLLQALQQVMPAFNSNSLSFTDQKQDAQANNANQNAFNGNSNPGQWSEGQSYAEQGGRQAPAGRSYDSRGQDSSDAAAVRDTGRRQSSSGSIYL